MVSAYILIQTEVGKAAQVTEKIRVLAANKGTEPSAGSGRTDLRHRHTGLPVTPRPDCAAHLSN